MGTIHFITFSTGISRVTGNPYSITQKLLVDTIQSQTNRKVIIHEHNLESLKKQPWFYKIENLPKINMNEKDWARDGYFCAYKIMFAHALMNYINDGDCVYYTDSSAYHLEGFTENIDRFFDYVDYNGNICGSFGTDFRNNSFGCADNKNIWEIVCPSVDESFDEILRLPHILASWYCFKKNTSTIQFFNDWLDYAIDTLYDGNPLITHHHTVDQSIFNMLVYKYKFKSFFNNTNHDHNKNHNNVHRFINNLKIENISDLDEHFLNPVDFNNKKVK
jgi:hypothetical protein